MSAIGIAPHEGYNTIHSRGRGMYEAVICVILVFLGIVGAFPVAFKAVKEHTVDEADNVVSEKHEIEHHDEK
ncbi:hypothetical protein BGX20_005985, partial [Mortierella sp. AD010]